LASDGNEATPTGDICMFRERQGGGGGWFFFPFGGELVNGSFTERPEENSSFISGSVALKDVRLQGTSSRVLPVTRTYDHDW